MYQYCGVNHKNRKCHWQRVNHVGREYRMLEWVKCIDSNNVKKWITFFDTQRKWMNQWISDRQSEPGASRVTIDRSEPRLKIVSKKMSESASTDSDIGYKWIKSMDSSILSKWTRNAEYHNVWVNSLHKENELIEC